MDETKVLGTLAQEERDAFVTLSVKLVSALIICSTTSHGYFLIGKKDCGNQIYYAWKQKNPDRTKKPLKN